MVAKLQGYVHSSAANLPRIFRRGERRRVTSIASAARIYIHVPRIYISLPRSHSIAPTNHLGRIRSERMTSRTRPDARGSGPISWDSHPKPYKFFSPWKASLEALFGSRNPIGKWPVSREKVLIDDYPPPPPPPTLTRSSNSRVRLLEFFEISPPPPHTHTSHAWNKMRNSFLVDTLIFILFDFRALNIYWI
jgi:hypothetical protein